MLSELLPKLKYDEFKIYYITAATSLLAFILLRWARQQRDTNTNFSLFYRTFEKVFESKRRIFH